LDKTSGLVDKNTSENGCGINHRNCMVLATSHNDLPRATPVEFFNEDLTIYIFAEPGGKLANLKSNQNVSAAIYEQPLDHSKLQKSLQIFGIADILTHKSHAKLLETKVEKWNILGAAERMHKNKTKAKNLSKSEKASLRNRIYDSMSIIRITLQRATLREYHPDFSAPRYRWKKDHTVT
jgi:nitroimidazol reductase NimA-like FMN-containing flavoprotein (pyridoxamine 5'-phosphate oxidase superfamily)